MNLPPLPYISIITFAPLVGTFIIMMMRRENVAGIRWTAVITTGISLLTTILVWLAYDQSKGGVQFRDIVPLVPQFGISLNLGVDGISMPLVLLNGIIGFGGALVSWNEIDERRQEFFGFFTLLVSGVFGVFVSMDLFMLFLFYELAVLPMYVLVAIWGTPRMWRQVWYKPRTHDPARAKTKEYAAMKLTLFLLFGSAVMLVGILAVFLVAQGVLGKPTFDILELASVRYDPNFQRAVFLPIFLGFVTLASLWPLHIWSPDGYAAAPTAASMIHAGVLKKMGAYGALRVAMFILPEGAHTFLPIIAGITLINAIYCAMVALQQRDLKYMIGYSSVSHLGLVLLGLASMNQIGMTGAVMMMFAHGLMAGLLFACTGFLYHQAHTRDLGDFGGLARTTPFLATCFTIGAMASLGLPGLSGFVAELLIFIGAWQFQPWIAAIAITSVVLTAVYLLRSVQFLFYGQLNAARHSLHDMRTFVQRAPVLLMIGVLFLFGILPFLMTNMINSSIGSVVAQLASATGQAVIK